jgi:hypothetical protein
VATGYAPRNANAVPERRNLACQPPVKTPLLFLLHTTICGHEFDPLINIFKLLVRMKEL